MHSRFAIATLAVCGVLSASAPLIAQPASAPVRIEQPWIRWLPAGLPAAGYAKLESLSDHAAILTGASSPAFGEIALHRTVTHTGTMSMIPADRIALAPHATLEFAPGGYHMMLMRPTRELHPGERVPITLQFASGARATALFEVRDHE
jgi:copper(I)-binding protein